MARKRNRYTNFDNILWMHGGDRNPGKAMEEVRAIAQGILETDKRHLHTAHWSPEHPGAKCYDSYIR